MQRSSPDASTGLIRLDASITPPEAAPAPMIVWISSINITAPSIWCSSANTALSRFSKSPRYFVPASNAPRSSEYIVASARILGTSLSVILSANPSAMAVLPTPASPTNSGLFLRLRHRTWMVRSTSLARPISGSILPSRARSFRLLVKLSNALLRVSAPPSSVSTALSSLLPSTSVCNGEIPWEM